MTEHEWHGDLELMRYIGEVCHTELEAADAGLVAAKDWLRKRLMWKR